MIDTNKYEGHTEDIGRWQMMGSSLPIWANDKDEQLVRDAVYLLEEVKRLRKGIIDFANKWKHNYSTKELLEMIE
jgi:hypothetical protein